jgi:hypothetical protein
MRLPLWLRSEIALIVVLVVSGSSPPPALATDNHHYAGHAGTAVWFGIDGYLRQSQTAPIPDTTAHWVWIGLTNGDASEWVQTGTYQGSFAGGTSLAAVHIYYENMNPCGDYFAKDKGAPPSANYPYYINYGGQPSQTIGCNDGSHRTAFAFPYRKGSFGNLPFFTGFLSWTQDYPQALTETYFYPTIGTDYLGCQDSGGVCFNQSYGIHVYTQNSTWAIWTGPAGYVNANPPYRHTYNNYWSVATCPVAC